MRAYVFGAACGLAFCACQDDTVIQRLPPPAIQVDVLKQKPAAEVDILWVVDNSGSMVEEQENIAANFTRFITGLTLCRDTNTENDRCDFATKKCTASGAPCNPPNYHIGVISSDVAHENDQGKLRKVGLCVPALGASPNEGKHKYCAGDNRDCQQDPRMPDPEFDPVNRACDMGQAISFITPTTQGAESAFSRVVRVGVGGSGLEQGIRAAAMALGVDADRETGQFVPVPAENAGFLRPNASLFVIFVSDEEDSSFGQVSYFYRAFESVKGAGNEGLVSFSAIVGDPDLDGMGPMPGGCGPDPMTPIAGPGARYIALAMYSRGLSAEFRVCDQQRLTCPADQECQAPIADFPKSGATLGVCVPTTCQNDQACGNFKCGETGCVVCENSRCVAKADTFVDLLTRNGIFGSLCAPDYGVVLGSLGFEAAGLSRKFPIGKVPDCVGEGGVDCGGAKAGICVKVDGKVIPNERATGWVWEPSSKSIFFDGSYVPQTDASIEISYRVVTTGDKPNGCEALK